MTITYANPDFFINMARESGAEIRQLSDGRWLVASPEGADKVAARCFKRLETAAQLYCCDVELVLPISK